MSLREDERSGEGAYIFFSLEIYDERNPGKISLKVQEKLEGDENRDLYFLFWFFAIFPKKVTRQDDNGNQFYLILL